MVRIYHKDVQRHRIGGALIKNPGNVSVAVKGVVYVNCKNKTQRIRKNKVFGKAGGGDDGVELTRV